MEPIKKNHNGNSRTEKINTVYVLSEQKSQSKRVGELKDRSVEIPILNTEGKTVSGTLNLPKCLTSVS